MIIDDDDDDDDDDEKDLDNLHLTSLLGVAKSSLLSVNC